MPAEREKRVGAVRKALDETGLVVTTAATSLSSHPLFALAARGMAFEQLDQLALEHLLGVR